MDIKITNGTSPAGVADAVEKSEGAEAGAEVTASEESTMDPVTGIAEDLAAGKIDRDGAIDRLIEHAMKTKSVSSAPHQLREEIASVLDNLIRTDPQLRSLARGMGLGEDR